MRKDYYHKVWFLLETSVEIVFIYIFMIYGQMWIYLLAQACPRISYLPKYSDTIKKTRIHVFINIYGVRHICVRRPRKLVIGKQCRPGSDAAECGVWSGYPLFANSLGISKSHTCRLTYLKFKFNVFYPKIGRSRGCFLGSNTFFPFRVDTFQEGTCAGKKQEVTKVSSAIANSKQSSTFT